MTTKKNRQIKNDIKPPEKRIVGVPEGELLSELYKCWHIVFDLSFKGCFCSIDESDFNNCLKDAEDFAIQYRDCMNSINKLSSHTLHELIDGRGFRHCHLIDTDEKKAYKIIKKICDKVNLDDSYFKQNIESESVFQIGFEGPVRFFGTIKGNVFRLLFVDYFHDFSYDERYNQRNPKNYKYCPMG